jgi:hypothetical protein
MEAIGMEIKNIDYRPYPAVIPAAEPATPSPPPQSSFHVPSTWVSEEIIDFIEVHSDNDHPILRRKSHYPIYADLSLHSKGKWINIWI